MHNYNCTDNADGVCSGRLVVGFFMLLCVSVGLVRHQYLEILNIQRKIHGSLKQATKKKEFSFWKCVFRIVPNVCCTSGTK